MHPVVISEYYKWYIDKRIHWSLNGQTPDTLLKKYNLVPIENKKLLIYF